MMYELRSRTVLKEQPESSLLDPKRRRITRHDKKKNSTPWWMTPEHGKAEGGWFLRRFRISDEWNIHPSRLPAKWGPYSLPNGDFDADTYRSDLTVFTYGLIPLLPPSERKSEAEILAQSQPTQCAEIALAYYNKTNGMEFALVKAVELNVIVCSGIWFHVNFEAKAQDAHCADPSANCLFFAELTLAEPNKMEAKCCVRVDSDDSGVIGCIFCHSVGKKICHPAQGFRRGFTFTDTKPRRIYLDVNSDGMFEFEKWYDNQYVRMQTSKRPRGPIGQRKGPAKVYRKQCTNLARKALAHYNQETGNHFKLVEAVSSAAFRHVTPQCPYPLIWSHVNFKAKPNAINGNDSSPKLFFAEMYKKGEATIVTQCTILEPNDIGEPRCRYCIHQTLHPVAGYEGYVPPGSAVILRD